jgi:hypothetical protein
VLAPEFFGRTPDLRHHIGESRISTLALHVSGTVSRVPAGITNPSRTIRHSVTRHT